MGDFGEVLIALLAILGPLLLAGWLLGRQLRSGPRDPARLDRGADRRAGGRGRGRDNMGA